MANATVMIDTKLARQVHMGAPNGPTLADTGRPLDGGSCLVSLPSGTARAIAEMERELGVTASEAFMALLLAGGKEV